jgi:hypothetical protein
MSVSSLKDLCIDHLLLDPPALRERLRPEDLVLPQDLKEEIQSVLDGFISSMEHLGVFVRYFRSHPEFYKIFLKRYPGEMRYLKNCMGWSGPGCWAEPLLHFAVSSEDEDLLLYLLEKVGTDIDVRSADTQGESPLAFAVRRCSPGTVNILLSHGANVNAVDLHGNTPLMHAAFQGKEEICRILLEKGADDRPVDRRGRTALDYAREDGHNMDNIRELSRLSRNRTIRKTCTMGLYLFSAASLAIAAWVLPKMMGE